MNTIEEIKMVDVDRLKTDKAYRLEQLRQFTEISAQAVTAAALALRAMDEAGDEIPQNINPSWLRVLRRVASNQAMPELFVSLRWDRRLLERASAFNMDQQRQLANDEPITFVVIGPDGRTDTRMVRPSAMMPSQIKQAFSDTGIRPEAEQIAWLENERTKIALKARPTVNTVEVDKRRGGIVVASPTFITKKELLRCIQDLG